MPWITAPQCERCWIDANAEYDLAKDGRRIGIGMPMPVRITEPVPETCHWCGALTISGIYVRAKVPS